MPKGEKTGEDAEQRNDQTLGDRFRSILEQLTGGQMAQQGQGIISNIDISKLLTFIIGEKPDVDIKEEISEAKKDIEELLSMITKISRDYTDIYASDGISRIYMPGYGSVNVDARLGTVAILLGRSIRIAWDRVRALIKRHERPEVIYKAAREAELFTQLSYLILVEIYNKMTTLYFINAPPKARPPLVNASLGYEIISS